MELQKDKKTGREYIDYPNTPFSEIFRQLYSKIRYRNCYSEYSWSGLVKQGWNRLKYIIKHGRVRKCYLDEFITFDNSAIIARDKRETVKKKFNLEEFMQGKDILAIEKIEQ